jgi:hypothetical protein
MAVLLKKRHAFSMENVIPRQEPFNFNGGEQTEVCVSRLLRPRFGDTNQVSNQLLYASKGVTFVVRIGPRRSVVGVHFIFIK